MLTILSALVRLLITAREPNGTLQKYSGKFLQFIVCICNKDTYPKDTTNTSKVQPENVMSIWSCTDLARRRTLPPVRGCNQAALLFMEGEDPLVYHVVVVRFSFTPLCTVLEICSFN